MKIKKIEFQSNPILKNLTLDFTSNNGKAVDTIIFAGENGCGKSTILNAIYEFSDFNYNAHQHTENRNFTVEFSENEILKLKENEAIKARLIDDVVDNEFIFSFTFPFKNWNDTTAECYLKNGQKVQIAGNLFAGAKTKPVFSSLFSDVEINFTPNRIASATAIEVDEEKTRSRRTSSSLATEIAQMLVDIQSSDAHDFHTFAKNNIGGKIEEKHLQLRMERFTNAFSYVFEKKRYKEVRNINGGKAVIFEENGKEIPINDLSSGEKQIVFRGSFLLKDQKSNSGCLVLIDEPEISLHPKWQIKIVEYYKKLFTDENDTQTSQLFIVTHSPFVIHNKSRHNDKVIVMTKDSHGNIIQSQQPKYHQWSTEEIIQDAFNVDFYSEHKSPLIITEGKTDWKHLKNALNKDKSDNLDITILEYEDDKLINGDSGLKSICKQISKIPKEQPVICIFDRDIESTTKEMHDEENGFKVWGNATYSFCIPTPEFRKGYKYITIESYYKDEEIKTADENGRRLFLTSEFSEKSGKHREEPLINYANTGYLKNNTDKLNAKIIDSKVYNNADDNIALSKSDFATNILNQHGDFSKISTSEFKHILDILRKIIANNQETEKTQG